MLEQAVLDDKYKIDWDDSKWEEYPDRIGTNYNDKVILITGGTGFMGKVLVEKLLRCCSGLKKIYLLMRVKKGKDPKERLKEVFSGPLFNMLREQKGEEIFEKVQAVQGDCSEADLGLSKESRKFLTENVQIIFHGAATIRFDEALRKAVLLNVRGTKLMLELAKECKKLLVFSHISTAYCHLHERVLYEKAYPPPASPHHVIKACEWMSDEVIDSITDKILGDIPNTYAFTKALGESLVNDEMDNLPVVILRPSVVIPIWLEPLPGWTDNINGPTGLLIGAGKGVIRTMYCHGDSYADYLPVDIAVNALICSVYDYMFFGERRIYNCTTSSEYKVSWEEIIEMGRAIIETKMPLNGVLWYPGGSMKKSKILHNFCFVMFQLIPAIFIDALLFVLGYKPLLVKIQKRIYKGYEVFEYYANKQWDFDNVASMKARALMNPKEKRIYRLDGDGINYSEYFTDCIHAARLNILKESDESIPSAQRHMKIMYCLDKFCKTLIVLSFFYYVYTKLLAPIFGI